VSALARNPRLYVALGALGLIALVSIFAPWIAGHDPREAAPENQLLEPSREYPFGTDLLGRDVFSRVVYGGRRTLGVALLTVVVTLLPGIAIALGGGLGVQGDVCGAVTGCALALSLAAAGKTKDYAERKKLAMPAMGRLYQAFAGRCGAVRCSDICGLDLRTPEGMAGLVTGARAEKCAPVVVVAARLLGEEIRRMSGSLK